MTSARIGPPLYAETCLPSHHLTLYYHATIVGTPRPDRIEIDGHRYAPLEEVVALLRREAIPWLLCRLLPLESELENRQPAR